MKGFLSPTDMLNMPAFKGAWLLPDDAEFEAAAVGELWNLHQPSRRPDIIARVTDDDDVIYAIRYAREHGLKVVVRGGGHNWACPSLRNGGLMIDLSNLTRVISIDQASRRAVVEPIISNRRILAELEPYDLAFPSGHCPAVKLSGYLLSGGMSWNHGVWGPGCGSVEAIEMVTAEGKLITASASENADYFWAARGGGPGLFAVCLRYHLRLYDRPKYIACTSYLYPLEQTDAVAAWLGPVADTLTPNVELSLFLITHAEFGRICMVTATTFADSKAEADAAVAPLETCPILDRCLARTFSEKSSFEGIFDLSGSLWPNRLRSAVDAMFSNESLATAYEGVAELFRQAPSDKTVFMYAVYTGGHAPALPADAFFSVTGRLYGGSWTMWDDEADNSANLAWHDRVMAHLDDKFPYRYVSETDTVGHPEFVAKAYSPEHLARMESLRRQYDPDGLFFGYHDGLN